MNLNNKTLKFLEKKWVLLILTFFISFTFFSWLQSSAVFSDPDSFYHTRIISMMSKQGVIHDFPWLQQTMLSENFTDHHFLFHFILIPIFFIFQPMIAMKIGSVFLSSLFVLFLAWYLKKKNIKYAWVYILMLLTITPFIFRLNIPKASALALLLLFIGIYLIENKKYYLLFILSFLYVWSHGGFLLLLIVAGLFFIVEVIFKKLKKLKIDFKKYFKIFISIILGFITGLVINPYFPGNIKFYWQQVIQIGLVNYKDEIEVGAEWYSYQMQDLLGSTNLIWILFVGAALVFVFYIKKIEVDKFQWLALVILFLVATIRSRRFVEYLVPVLLMWCVFILNWFLVSPYFNEQFIKFKKSWIKNRKWYNLLTIYMLIVIPFGIGQSIHSAKKSLDDGWSINKFEPAMRYLQENSNSGDIVFHGQWDDWPVYFYHNQHNYYLVGLDATFMYKYDKYKYERWREISEGKVITNIADEIKNNFNSKYIVIEKENEDTKLFHAFLQRDNNIELIYHDQEASLYKIN